MIHLINAYPTANFVSRAESIVFIGFDLTFLFGHCNYSPQSLQKDLMEQELCLSLVTAPGKMD
jgi:hypothetical protein